jgi:hypothetical protein
MGRKWVENGRTRNKQRQKQKEAEDACRSFRRCSRAWALLREDPSSGGPQSSRCFHPGNQHFWLGSMGWSRRAALSQNTHCGAHRVVVLLQRARRKLKPHRTHRLSAASRRMLSDSTALTSPVEVVGQKSQHGACGLRLMALCTSVLTPSALPDADWSEVAQDNAHVENEGALTPTKGLARDMVRLSCLLLLAFFVFCSESRAGAAWRGFG